MRAAIPILGALMLLAWAPTPAYAIVPCIKEHLLVNEFIDEDTGHKGRIKYQAVMTEIPGPVPQYEMDGQLALLDVVTGDRLNITWGAVADSEPLAHASYLVAVDAALFKGGGSATGITLRRVDLRGRAKFATDDLLRILALVASSYGAIGGPDYAGAILDVAGELKITLPDLMQRPR
jgi:hypothetical protein